jgi:hypothetical protein
VLDTNFVNELKALVIRGQAEFDFQHEQKGMFQGILNSKIENAFHMPFAFGIWFALFIADNLLQTL